MAILRLRGFTQIDVTQYHPKDIPEHYKHDWAYDKSNPPPTKKFKAAQVSKDHQEHTAEQICVQYVINSKIILLARVSVEVLVALHLNLDGHASRNHVVDGKANHSKDDSTKMPDIPQVVETNRLTLAQCLVDFLLVHGIPLFVSTLWELTFTCCLFINFLSQGFHELTF